MRLLRSARPAARLPAVIGQVLDILKELGIEDNAIAVKTT
jgi:hypothetical protein